MKTQFDFLFWSTTQNCQATVNKTDFLLFFPIISLSFLFLPSPLFDSIGLFSLFSIRFSADLDETTIVEAESTAGVKSNSYSPTIQPCILPPVSSAIPPLPGTALDDSLCIHQANIAKIQRIKVGKSLGFFFFLFCLPSLFENEWNNPTSFGFIFFLQFHHFRNDM